eukprot:TRINITY_DN3825_c0_g1_i1.p1 TRINITY_DN3825_c0_g1~~TRINITY_DN3825_c0_g1_i1.p1  ORF type:complete len:199 (-),score=24.52 TRINITY_DN3825_c0_g1_i1:143-739(-)
MLIWEESVSYVRYLVNISMSSGEVNLARVQKLNLICGRNMPSNVSTLFWKQIMIVVRRLVITYGAQGVALEVSYGNWIKHHHAHVHILCTNMPAVLDSLKMSRIVGCDLGRLKPKMVYGGDATVKLPFSPKLETLNWSKFPLFRLCKDWFGSLPGFVVRVELTFVSNEFDTTYHIRADCKDQEQLTACLNCPPRGLKF